MEPRKVRGVDKEVGRDDWQDFQNMAKKALRRRRLAERRRKECGGVGGDAEEGGGWLWGQLLAARSRLTGVAEWSAQKKALLRERPRSPVIFSAVPMPDDSV